MEKNIFNISPQVRKQILSKIKLKTYLEFNGKAFLCLLVNSRCHVGCNHCMFSSKIVEKRNKSNTLTGEGVEKVLRFIHESNVGYLLLSSAGESFLELKHILRIIEKANIEVAWVVTSGYWANRINRAEKILSQLHGAFVIGQTLNQKRTVYIRISVDNYHIKKLQNSTDKFRYIINIVNIFEKKYRRESMFKLLIHSLEVDRKLILELASRLSADIRPASLSDHHAIKYPGKIVIITLPSGYSFEVTFAKLLLSNREVELNNEITVQKAIQVFNKDLYESENGNPSIKYNKEGVYAPNMLIWYDGSVSLGWQSEMPDLGLNIYEQDYQYIRNKSLSDPGTLATLENGFDYRSNIINEVNPKAVIRAKAVNIRDYTSIVLLEEDKTKVYYCLRALQDYLRDGRIKDEVLKVLPENIVEAIKMDPKELAKQYHKSSFDIVSQRINDDELFMEFVTVIKQAFKIECFECIKKYLESNTSLTQENLKNWKLLFQRIVNNWYEISSFDENEILLLPNIIKIIDNTLQQFTSGVVHDPLHGYVKLSKIRMCRVK